MHIQIACDTLGKILHRTQDFLNKNTPEYLAFVLLETTPNGLLKVAATDLETSFEGTVQIDKLTRQGKILLEGKRLYSFVKSLSVEMIDINVDESFVASISYGKKASVKFHGLDPEIFPKIDASDVDEMAWTEVFCSPIKDLFKKTIFSASQDETRVRLTGVFLEGKKGDKELTSVATDGHRLSLAKRQVCDNGLSNDFSMIIPRKCVAIVSKLLDSSITMQVAHHKGSFVVKTDSFLVQVRLIDEEFPNYKSLIPTTDSTLYNLPINEVRNILKVMQTLCERGDKQDDVINLKIVGKELFITYSTSERSFVESVDIENPSNRDLKISYSVKYFVEAMNQVEGEYVKALFGSTELKPTIYKDPKYEHDLFLLMARKGSE